MRHIQDKQWTLVEMTNVKSSEGQVLASSSRSPQLSYCEITTNYNQFKGHSSSEIFSICFQKSGCC